MSEPPVLAPIAASPVSILLLAHNAEAALEEVLRSWSSQLERLPAGGEILLVDQGSSDRTRTIAEGLTRHLPAVRVLPARDLGGQGAALRAGLRAARHPLVFYTTCDGAFQARDLSLLLAEIDKVHLVMGFRSWRKVPAWLRGFGKLWSGMKQLVFSIPSEPLPAWSGWTAIFHAWLDRVFFGVRLRDPGCWFCLVRRSILARMPVQSDGRFAQDEMLAKSNFLGCIMMEVPIRYQPAPGKVWKETTGSRLRDIHRVLHHPDFGPAKLPLGSTWSLT